MGEKDFKSSIKYVSEKERVKINRKKFEKESLAEIEEFIEELYDENADGMWIKDKLEIKKYVSELKSAIEENNVDTFINIFSNRNSNNLAVNVGIKRLLQIAIDTKNKIEKEFIELVQNTNEKKEKFIILKQPEENEI